MLIHNDGRKKKSVTKQIRQRQVADVEPDNVADHRCKLPRILVN